MFCYFSMIVFLFLVSCVFLSLDSCLFLSLDSCFVSPLCLVLFLPCVLFCFSHVSCFFLACCLFLPCVLFVSPSCLSCFSHIAIAPFLWSVCLLFAEPAPHGFPCTHIQKIHTICARTTNKCMGPDSWGTCFLVIRLTRTESWLTWDKEPRTAVPRGRSASRKRRLRGRSPSGKTNRQPCKNFLKGTCTKLPCH